MTPNELLLWLSARQKGSWPQFRAAVEKLELEDQENEAESEAALPVHLRICFNLERLGHVEFGAKGCEDGWRIVPPTLALYPHHGKATGVLCGARTPKLIAKLQEVCGPLAIEQTPKPDCPDIRQRDFCLEWRIAPVTPHAKAMSRAGCARFAELVEK
jgi:hypothetical protein